MLVISVGQNVQKIILDLAANIRAIVLKRLQSLVILRQVCFIDYGSNIIPNLCLPGHCTCQPGYFGSRCEHKLNTCQRGMFGSACDQQCNCDNNIACDKEGSNCICDPGIALLIFS